jgi:hypothetical protein
VTIPLLAASTCGTNTQNLAARSAPVVHSFFVDSQPAA